MAKELSKREREFAEHLALGTTQRQAALLAGYSESGASAQACRLLKRPQVYAHYQKCLESQMNSIGVSKQSIQAKLVEIINKQGVADTDKLKALDMLNKMFGFYMRPLDKLLGLTAEEVQAAVRDMQSTLNTTYQLINHDPK